MRLEFLFDIFQERRAGTSSLDTRDSIKALFDIMDLLSRSDLKSELIKELERNLINLKKLNTNPNVDQSQLSDLLEEINTQLELLHNPDLQPGKLFSQHELIVSIKQRSMITGGGCNFDLPNYHYWLNLPLEIRNNLVNEMHEEILSFEQSIRLCLHILRNMGSPTSETAISGFYQQNLDPRLSCYLLRVLLNKNVNYFPEISAGKHRFSIRFMSLNTSEERPQQIKTDVPFHLICCMN